jgi:CBS-domain-containing membrane protein
MPILHQFRRSVFTAYRKDGAQFGLPFAGIRSIPFGSMKEVKAWMGIEWDETGWPEKIVASAGAFLAIAGTIGIGRYFYGPSPESFVVFSMGATVFLLFAAPLGKFSQPWPVLAGHVLSALVGVSCHKLIPDTVLAAACAVGFAVLGMQLLGCLHPPGGSTALIAVIAGPKIFDLGYSFALWPVGVNALGLVLFAVAFNFWFPWRRYPARFHRPKPSDTARADISHEAVLAAVRSIDSFVDVTEDDIVRLYESLSAGKPVKTKGG